MKQLLILAAMFAASFLIVRGSAQEVKAAEVEMREARLHRQTTEAAIIAVNLLTEIAKASQGRGDAVRVAKLRRECEALKRELEAAR